MSVTGSTCADMPPSVSLRTVQDPMDATRTITIVDMTAAAMVMFMGMLMHGDGMVVMRMMMPYALLTSLMRMSTAAVETCDNTS